jgi:predicted enzyme related to lactoylglutathione lyase
MVDHISIGARDIARAKRFYDAALKWTTRPAR